MRNKKKVFIGLSGGVDSSVSAMLLKKAGYEVVGVFMRTWHPDFLSCNEEKERLDAMRVAAYLDIPFLTFDFEDIYKKEVADYMINEYKKGRTPNPDVMCNKEVKFGAFLDKAISMGADYVATGHYAQKIIQKSSKNKKDMFYNSHFNLNVLNEFNIADVAESNPYRFLKGIDPLKDQSYFLWTLKQKQLAKILFPIGHLKKEDVRRLAKKWKLPVAEKKDSQGICFLGNIDLKDFLKHYIKEKKGKVLNIENEEIGYHNGVVFHTLGERRGFTITKRTPNDKPYYIVGKNIKKNILTVSQKRPDITYVVESNPSRFLERKNMKKNIKNILTVSQDKNCLALENTNWISGIPKEGKKYTAQIRYHGEFLTCTIVCQSPTLAKLFFEKPVLVDSGQSCVIYEKNIVLGGGIVI